MALRTSPIVRAVALVAVAFSCVACIAIAEPVTGTATTHPPQLPPPPPPPSQALGRIEVSREARLLIAGGTVGYTISGVDSLGNPMRLRDVSWKLSDENVAQIVASTDTTVQLKARSYGHTLLTVRAAGVDSAALHLDVWNRPEPVASAGEAGVEVPDFRVLYRRVGDRIVYTPVATVLTSGRLLILEAEIELGGITTRGKCATRMVLEQPHALFGLSNREHDLEFSAEPSQRAAGSPTLRLVVMTAFYDSFTITLPGELLPYETGHVDERWSADTPWSCER